MPNTYTLIASNTVGSGGVASVTFSSIPSTYTDLVVKTSLREATTNNAIVKINFNGTTSGYTAREIIGNGTSASSDTNYGSTYYGVEGSSAPSNATANSFTNNEYYIPNYASSNYKSISTDSIYETNTTFSLATLSSGLWSNTAAITSIALAPYSGNFAQYSTFYLYGIKNS